MDYSGILIDGRCVSGICFGIPHQYISGAKTFDTCYKEIEKIVEQKRYEYTFNASKMRDFDDFKWKTIHHISIKWDLLDQTKSIGGWVKTIVDNQWINMLRDEYLGTASPCRGCACAEGDFSCTLFVEQASMSCPKYTKWYDSNKRHKHAARMPLTMETKENQAAISSIPDCGFDTEKAVEELHVKIKPLLTDTEWEIYNDLFIEGLTEEATAIKRKFKTSENGKKAGYRRIREVKKTIKEKVKELLAGDGLDLQFL